MEVRFVRWEGGGWGEERRGGGAFLRGSHTTDRVLLLAFKWLSGGHQAL